MKNALRLAEIEALLSANAGRDFSGDLESEFEKRLGPARRRHLTLALLLVAVSVVIAALLDHANAVSIFERTFDLRVSVVVLSLAGAGLELVARTGLQEMVCYAVPLLGEAALAAWAGRSGPPIMIDRNIMMSLMLFAVLCGVPPVPGKAARVIAVAIFAVFTLTFWQVEGGAMLVQHMNGLAAGGMALLVGAILSRRREHARRRDFLQTLRAELTAAELSRLNAELERLTHTDVLTGVANRRRFEADLASAWSAGFLDLETQRQMSRSLGLLLVDVDHFKAFNDAAGHAEGDRCLRAVAGAIANVTRGGSSCMARWGGEEFVVLAPGIHRAELAVLAERVRRSVESLLIPHPAWPGRFVTVSIGAAWTGEGSLYASPDDLLREADNALYAAKRSGRNIVAGAEIRAASGVEGD